jgi:hypothetical protein
VDSLKPRIRSQRFRGFRLSRHCHDALFNGSHLVGASDFPIVARQRLECQCMSAHVCGRLRNSEQLAIMTS